MSRAFPSRWLGLLLAFLPIGCVPGIVWLPDSTGFVYTTGRSTSQLRHFDVAKGEDRVLVEDTGTATLLPAISPDGKRLAVARIVRDKGVPDALQLVFYDLKGKESGRSRTLRWVRPGERVDQHKLVACYLYWDHVGDRVLVSDMFDDHPMTSIYDLKTDRFRVVEGAFPSAFGGTPFRPDGKGFLVGKPGKNPLLRFAFVEWGGALQPIAMEPNALDDNDKREMLSLPWLCNSSWNGNVAQVQRGAIGIQLDTAKLTGGPVVVPPGEATFDGAIIVRSHPFPGTDLTLRLLHSEKLAAPDDRDHQRLVAMDAKTRKTTVVMDKLAFCVLFPSPDKMKVAAWCSIKDVNAQDERQFFLVINQTGKIVGQTSVKE